MPYRLAKRWTTIAILLMAVVISAACGSRPDDTGADPQPEWEPGPGSFAYLDTRAGLADLSSYKASLTYTFDGTRDGSAEQWSKTYVMLATRDPAARQLTIVTEGSIPAIDPVFMAEAEQAVYTRTADGACSAELIEGGASLGDWLEPAGILYSVVGAEDGGTDRVNEIASHRYTFDERAFGQAGLTESTGEMWVASEGGFLVRYLLTSSGGEDFFGEGIAGTLSWAYELTDVNQPLSLDVPEDCPPGLVDAPLLPDASNVMKAPGMLAYDTAASLTEVVAFHQEQVPLLGWAPLGEPSSDEATVLLEYAQGDREMLVLIIGEEAVTRVRILLQPAAE